jgi:hypothetical protein
MTIIDVPEIAKNPLRGAFKSVFLDAHQPSLGNRLLTGPDRSVSHATVILSLLGQQIRAYD